MSKNEKSNKAKVERPEDKAGNAAKAEARPQELTEKDLDKVTGGDIFGGGGGSGKTHRVN